MRGGHVLGAKAVRPAVRQVALALAIAILAVPLAGCVTPDPGDEGPRTVVVTGQPALDAFDRLDQREHVVGIPDWAGTDEPWNATRLGRPFTIEPETVIRVGPDLVLDQPHPLVSGPSRTALATGMEQAGIPYQRLPIEPTFSTIRTTLEAAENVSGAPAEPAWRNLTASLDELNRTLEGTEQPKALVLFPAGLTAGTGTDADLLLELAGLTNVAAEAGLSGYRQISTEAVRRVGVDLVIATSTMRETPTDIAGKPMLDDTRVDDDPERVLVVDPSRTMRVGPYLDRAAERVATWAHPSLPGPRIHATLDRSQVNACGQLEVTTSAPNATVHLLGDSHDPGTIPVPDVRSGHYQLTITAEDATGRASIVQLVTVEGSKCTDA